MKDIGIYRIEYEIIMGNSSDISMWTAVVAATSPEDAEMYIRNYVQRPIRVLVNGFLVKLDGISYDVRALLSELGVIGKPARPEEVKVGKTAAKKDTTPKTLASKTTTVKE